MATAIVFIMILATITGIWEGAAHAIKKANERKAWKQLKSIYYPQGMDSVLSRRKY